ncbi:MAG: hypothetical protein WC043_01015 [Pseudobdellovibrionaceae bacterium]
MFANNPEFRKNLKLEFNLTRFIIPALILALTAWIGWSSITPQDWKHLPLDYYKGESLHGWMSGFGFIFTIIWGTYLAANSLFGEMKQKTWDFVRMSSLSPAKILIGKLFGATSVVWVITLLGTVPLIIIAGTYMIPGSGIIRPEYQTIGSLILALMFWVILSHTFTLLVGLYAQNKESRHTSIGSALTVMMMGLTIGAIITENYSREYQILEIYHQEGQKPYMPEDAIVIEAGKFYMTPPQPVDWYSIKLKPLDATTFCLGFFALWSVIGAYRALRKSLQYKDSPWVWMTFLITMSLFLNGFTIVTPELRNFLIWPIVLSVSTLLVTCSNEAGDIIRYRQFADQCARKNFKEAFRLLPLWIISFAIFVVAALANILLIHFMLIHPESYSYSGYNPESTAHLNSLEFIKGALVFFGSLLVLMIRDILVFHVISWKRSIRRPLLGMIVYMAIFYGFAPAIADIFNNQSGPRYFFPFINAGAAETQPNLLLYFILHGGLITLVLLPFRRAWRTAFGEKLA